MRGLKIKNLFGFLALTIRARVIVSVVLIMSIAFFPREDAFSQDKNMSDLKVSQPIVVDGDTVEYFEDEGKIVAEGNVSIQYGDIKLTCDKIVVDTQNRMALCEGNVRIEHPEGTLTGSRIKYDFTQKKGEILTGEVKAFPWFGKAQETSKVAENEYLLKKGRITTCDLDQPHYRLEAQEIKIFPDDKVIAKNVVVYIGKVPVLWFPYYYHPIIQTKAKVQFIPGSTSDWGYFLLSAWRFYIRGNTRMDILVDYRSKKGFAEGVNLYYDTSDFDLDGLGEGMFRPYFIHQNDIGTYEKEPYKEDGTAPVLRKRFQWKHRIDFDPGTVGILEFNKLSDDELLKDFFYNEYEENNSVPNNYVSVVSARENYTFSIEANKRFNEFYDVTQRLPQLKLDVPDQRLWNTSIYYGSEWSGTIFNKEYANLTYPPEKVDRADSFHKFSYVTSLGPLHLTPYGTLRETFYSRTRWSAQATSRFVAGGGLDTFMRFHKVYDFNTDFMSLDINKVRHIVAPGVKYFHTHQPTVDKDNLYQMDDIDSLEKENGIRFSLENKLQTKRHSGKTLSTVDLARLMVNVDYLFRMEKDKFKFEKNGKFKDLNFELELFPYSWLYLDSDLSINTENQSVKSGSIEMAMNPNNRFNLAMGYRYEKLAPEPRNQLTFDLNYVINPKWRLGLYERFDFQDGTIEEQQISIVRDLHCWEVEVSYDVKGSNFLEDDFTFWVAFKVKAFPDLQLGLDRSFSKRPPGALPSAE